MKTTRIHIKNLFGISETELDGRSIEVTGSNGVGKTSIIDSIKYALTNDSSRDYVIKNGESEGEIFIETDTGLTIDRKKRVNQADYKNIRQDGKPVQSPEAFVRELFTPLQIDPVKFTQMSRQEQNRIILDLIEFDWDLNWIKEKFGEIPQGVDYQQNILQVLNDIQSEKGVYFQTRQDINREIRNKTAFISDIAKDIPQGFQAEKWEAYDLSEAYTKITKAQEYNSRIERAKLFKDSYDNKVRGYQAEMEIAVSNLKSAIAAEREQLTSEILPENCTEVTVPVLIVIHNAGIKILTASSYYSRQANDLRAGAAADHYLCSAVIFPFKIMFHILSSRGQPRPLVKSFIHRILSKLHNFSGFYLTQCCDPIFAFYYCSKADMTTLFDHTAMVHDSAQIDDTATFHCHICIDNSFRKNHNALFDRCGRTYISCRMHNSGKSAVCSSYFIAPRQAKLVISKGRNKFRIVSNIFSKKIKRAVGKSIVQHSYHIIAQLFRNVLNSICISACTEDDQLL